MLLTKHENETFHHQTVYISGQAFVGCTFTGCTLVLRETVYHLDGCTFDRCNWHVDSLLLWGSENGVRALRELVTLIEQGLEQVRGMDEPPETPSSGNGGDGGAKPTPFA